MTNWRSPKKSGLGYSEKDWQAMSRQSQVDALQQHFGRKFSAGQDIDMEIDHHLKHAWEFTYSELYLYFCDELSGD